MILSVQRDVHDKVADAARRAFGLTDIPEFSVEVPPNRAMGDLAVTVAFQLARTLRKPPKVIAQELARAAADIPGVTRVDVAPNGYLNLYLDRPAFLLARLDGREGHRNDSVALRAEAAKTIVEHTAINPNKA